MPMDIPHTREVQGSAVAVERSPSPGIGTPVGGGGSLSKPARRALPSDLKKAIGQSILQIIEEGDKDGSTIAQVMKRIAALLKASDEAQDAISFQGLEKAANGSPTPAIEQHWPSDGEYADLTESGGFREIPRRRPVNTGAELAAVMRGDKPAGGHRLAERLGAVKPESDPDQRRKFLRALRGIR